MDRKQRLINTSPNNKPRWFQIHWKWSTKFTSLSINHPTAWICSCTSSASLNGPLMKISTTRESSPMNIYNINNILWARVSEITLCREEQSQKIRKSNIILKSLEARKPKCINIKAEIVSGDLYLKEDIHIKAEIG